MSMCHYGADIGTGVLLRSILFVKLWNSACYTDKEKYAVSLPPVRKTVSGY